MKMISLAQGFALSLLASGVAHAAISPLQRFASADIAQAAVPSAPADFGGPSVTLTPIDGVSVTIPKNWIACDEANNAKLTPAPDTLSITSKLCAGPRSNGPITFGAFDPVPLQSAVIFAGKEPENPITEGVILRMSDDNLAKMGPEVCPIIEKPLLDAKSSIDSCTLKRSTIGGHTALVFDVLYTPPEGAIAQGELEAWVVPSSHGVVDFSIVWSVLVKDKIAPMLQAVRNSLQVQ